MISLWRSPASENEGHMLLKVNPLPALAQHRGIGFVLLGGGWLCFRSFEISQVNLISLRDGLSIIYLQAC